MNKWAGPKVYALTRLVQAEYGLRCWLCSGLIDPDTPRLAPGGFTVDHVIPRSKGGTDDLTNLRPAHRACNLSRGNRPPKKRRPPRRAPADWPGLPGRFF